MIAPGDGGGGGGSRERLVRTALTAFSTYGYDGVSLREIERQAGVNRSMIAHFFGTKERLWQEAVDLLMVWFDEEVVRYQDVLINLPPEERAQTFVRVLVRFSARAPEYFRLLIVTGNQDDEQSAYLTESVRPRIELFLGMADSRGKRPAAERASLLYIVAGALATIFTIPAQCQALFGVDPNEAEFVDAFIANATQLLRPLLNVE